ncbi:MAG: flavin reductase family protein [Desulfobacterales bacterium]|nr:flavin reductase family protein [Desulfobacterales bacterium]
MKVEPITLPRKDLHHFFAGLITPRPIAFVSTLDAEGRYNAAPFSAFVRLTASPPVLVFAAGRRKGKKKDTIRNIESTGDFVVNLVDEDLCQTMHQAGADYPPGIDEMKEVGLTAINSEKIKSPRILEAPISLECRLMQVLELGQKPSMSSIVFGEILLVHIQDEILTDGKVDPIKAKIIGRLGEGNIYCRTTDIFTLDRRPI